MFSYCYQCYLIEVQKNTENKNLKIAMAKNGRMMLFQNVQCVIAKTQKFIKSKKTKDY